MSILTCQNVSYCPKNSEKALLNNVTWSLEANQCVAMVGESGAGKSTLLKILGGLIIPTTGSVSFNDQPIPQKDKKALRAFAQRIGFIFQAPCLLNTKTVFDNVALPLRLVHTDETIVQQRVTDCLERVGLMGHAMLSPKRLSGGQKQRVGIAMALVKQPQVLLCDEPTSALDAQTAQEILTLIDTLRQRLGIAVVIVSHDLNTVQQMATHMAMLHQGQLVEHGPIDTLLMQPKSKQTTHWLEGYFTPLLGDTLKTKLAQQPITLLHLRFYQSTTFEPVLAQMMQALKVDITILQARIETFHTTVIGTLVIGLMQPHPPLTTLIRYLNDHTISAHTIDLEMPS